MTTPTQRRALRTRLAVGSPLTLGDALPAEMARVACDVIPEVARRGDDGRAALDAIKGSLRLAAYAITHADTRLMRRAHAELIDFQL
jgi:hypothetical protein